LINVFAVKWYGESEFWLSRYKQRLDTAKNAYNIAVERSSSSPLYSASLLSQWWGAIRNMMPTASDTGTLLYGLFQEELGAGPCRLMIFRGRLQSILQQVLLGDLKGF
jgi:hypothetical protein